MPIPAGSSEAARDSARVIIRVRTTDCGCRRAGCALRHCHLFAFYASFDGSRIDHLAPANAGPRFTRSNFHRPPPLLRRTSTRLPPPRDALRLPVSPVTTARSRCAIVEPAKRCSRSPSRAGLTDAQVDRNWPTRLVLNWQAQSAEALQETCP